MRRPSPSAPGRGDRPEPGLIGGWRRAILFAGLVLAAFMIANTLYLLGYRLGEGAGLAAFAFQLPPFLQVMLLGHSGVGLVMAAVLVVFSIAHLPVVWKARHASAIASGGLLIAGGLLLVATGVIILTRAASQQGGWAWWLHVILGIGVPLAYLIHRGSGHHAGAGRRMGAFGWGIGVLLGAMVLLHAVSPDGPRLHVPGDALQAYDGADSRFSPAGLPDPGGPFFPSPATTASGMAVPPAHWLGSDTALAEVVAREVAERGFAAGVRIGAGDCQRCHPDVVEQWAASAHRFSSFNNPFYEAAVVDLRNRDGAPNPWVARHLEALGVDAPGGRIQSKWCAGCHDPVLLFDRKIEAPIERASLAAQAGLTCMSCHGIEQIPTVTGNGNYRVDDRSRSPYLFDRAPSGSLGAMLNRLLVKARPEIHKRRMGKPVFQTSLYCATCHKVSLPPAINDYRWLRGQNEYDNWHASGIARNAAGTFYLPATARPCQTCHMAPEAAPLGDLAAKDGRVRSHRFPAANTALHALRGDSAGVRRVEAFLQHGRLRVDIFALRREDGIPLMPLSDTTAVVRPGETITLDVVVRNRDVGHTFPGGTIDAADIWLDVAVVDPSGRVVAAHGRANDVGQVDSLAHVYKAVFVDGDGRAIQARNAQDIRATVFANVIGPGQVDLPHYRLTIPADLQSPYLAVQVRLRFRKFDRAFTEFALASNPDGFRAGFRFADLPVFDIAADTVHLRMDGDRTALPLHAPETAPLWVRYNDYGIGLLLEGDLRIAALAFAEVDRIAPERVDGPLNRARVALAEGDLDAVAALLLECDRRAPNHPQVAWAWGQAHLEGGDYAAAGEAFERTLAAFPDDRATLRLLGRTHYLAGDYEQALAVYARVLRIDPEDRIAHYHRMLCWRALGNRPAADAAEAAYEYYRIDESAQRLTRDYRRRHPGANRMAQRIRIHDLMPIPAGIPSAVDNYSP